MQDEIPLNAQNHFKFWDNLRQFNECGEPTSSAPLSLHDSSSMRSVDQTISHIGNSSSGLTSIDSKNPVHNSQIDSLKLSDQVLVSIAFLSSGIVSLIIWNSIVNTFVVLQKVIWPGEVFLDLLGGFEYSAATLTSIIMLNFNSLQMKLFYISGIMNLIVTLSFPTIVYLYPGLENLKTAKILLICCSLLAGIGCGLSNVVGFSLAAIMKTGNAVALVSTGNGMAGVITFVSFLLLSEFAFPKTINGQTNLLFSFFSIGTTIILIQLVSLTLLNRRSWFKQIINQAIWSSKLPIWDTPLKSTQKQHSIMGTSQLSSSLHYSCSHSIIDGICIQSSKDSEFLLPPRSFKLVLSDCGVHALSGCLTIIITLLVFPLTGPYSWNQSYTMTTLLNGTFQVINMCMRYFPMLGEWTRIPPKWLLPVVVLRAIIFIPLFLLPSRFLSKNQLVHSPVFLLFLMLTFAAVHGWSITLASVYCTISVTHPKEKAIASKILVIGLLAASLLGTFGSKLLVL